MVKTGSGHVKAWRQIWEDLVNAALAAEGRTERLDMRSFVRQQRGDLPTRHLGPVIARRVQKRYPSERHERNQSIRRLRTLSEPSWRPPKPTSPEPEPPSDEQEPAGDAAEWESFLQLFAERAMAEITRYEWADLRSVKATRYEPGCYQVLISRADDPNPSVRLTWMPGRILLSEVLKITAENCPGIAPAERAPVAGVEGGSALSGADSWSGSAGVRSRSGCI